MTRPRFHIIIYFRNRANGFKFNIDPRPEKRNELERCQYLATKFKGSYRHAEVYQNGTYQFSYNEEAQVFVKR